jgi:hypothetical protein
MKKYLFLWLFLFCLGVLHIRESQASTQVENPIFSYTHLLPSPFTVPGGRFYFGTVTGVGVTDFLEIQTDVIADIYQIYNARAKLSLLDFPGFAAGLYLGYQSVNLNELSSLNPSLRINSWMPGGVLGMEILPYVALFFGGNLYYSNADVPDPNTLQTSGFLKGAEIESDISWAYNPHSNRTGNVLSAGVSYNSTYDFYGFGFSHHWKGFHLGIHYFPNASNLKVMPIVSGGAVIDM